MLDFKKEAVPRMMEIISHILEDHHRLTDGRQDGIYREELDPMCLEIEEMHISAAFLKLWEQRKIAVSGLNEDQKIIWVFLEEENA